MRKFVRIDKIRVWLKNNKIFFEIFAAVVLPTMAIFVSWEANQIVANQTEIMKSERLPVLYLNVAQIYDPNTKNYTQDELSIYNVGGPLSEFNFKEAVFFKIAYGRPPGEMKTALVPLIGYYSTGFVTNNPTGELAQLVNYEVTEGNNYKAVHTSWAFSDFASKKNALGFADIARYVKVTYKDVFGETHNEFYFASPMRTFKLSDIEGTKIFKQYEDNIGITSLDFYSEVSPESLYEKWSVIVNESNNT